MKERVHGKIIIKRRINRDKNSYQKNKDMLIEDFNGICGYCAKNSRVFLEDFQIDHFAPQSKFQELRDEYSNFVLACPLCNRLKSDKWVTEDGKVAHTESEGFVDPATEEFDEHLYRDENGNIIPKTEVGKYMCDIFKFNIRPISLIWKINQLEEYEKILRNDLSDIGAQEYRKVAIALRDILEYMRLDKKE